MSKLRCALLLPLLLLAPLAFAVDLPGHGGSATVITDGVKVEYAYYFESLPAPTGGRRFRVLVTPALPPDRPTVRELRLAGTPQGSMLLEEVGDGGSAWELLPGDPELQIECASGAVPSETRPYVVTVRVMAEYQGRTSESLYETVDQ